MKITLTLHAVKRYMEYCNIDAISRANVKLRSDFINIYTYGKITNSYNGRKEVIFEGDRIIYTEDSGDFLVITYTKIDKTSKDNYREIRKYKNQLKKQRRNNNFKQ